MSVRRKQTCGICVIGVLLAHTFFPSFGYAQGSDGGATPGAGACSTCMQAPSELDMYFRVLERLIALLNSGTPPDANQGTGSGLSNDLSDAAFATKMARDAALSSAVLSTVLVTNITSDVFAEFTLLATSQSRRREREKFLEFDHKISMGVIALARSDRIGRRLPKDILDEIDQELQKLGFVRLGKQGSSYNMERGQAKYEDLARMIRQMNFFVKQLHINKRYDHLLDEVGSEYLRSFSVDKEASFAEVEDQRLARTYQEVSQLLLTAFGGLTSDQQGALTEWLEFTNERVDTLVRVRQIQDAYVCSTGVKNLCNGRDQTASDARQFVRDRRQTDGGRAKDTFKTARSRLMGTLFKGDEEDKAAAKQREEALLRSIYGQDIPDYHKRRNQPGVDTTGSLPVDIETNIEPFPKSVSATWKGIAWGWKKLTEITKTKAVGNDLPAGTTVSDQENAYNQDNAKKFVTKQDKEMKYSVLKEYLESREAFVWTLENVDLRAITERESLANELRSLQTVYGNIVKEHTELAMEQGLFTDVNRVTKRFPQLSAAVHKNMLLIGDKDTDGVYDAMGNVCEMQCENLQGTCRYETD